MVQTNIERHLPPEQYEILKAAEASERAIITRLVGKIARKRHAMTRSECRGSGGSPLH